MAKIKTRAEVKADMIRMGVNINEWAREHHLPPATVHAVLNGHQKGRRGQAHRAAVLLGIKEGIAQGSAIA